MQPIWALVLITFNILTNSNAAVDTLTFTEPSLKISLTYSSRDWHIFETSDYVAAGSLFFAKPKTKDNSLGESTFSLRQDESPSADAKKYAEKWLKDYPKFGFELLLSQQVEYGQMSGFEIELASKKGNKKLRQFVTKNSDNKFLIFTCSSKKDEFETTLKHCQKLLNTAQNIKDLTK